MYTTDALLKEVEQKVEITVFLKTDPDPTTAQVEAMQTKIVGWTEVKSSTFVSKDEALQRLKDDFKDDPSILAGLTGNPLPASFEIALRDPQTVSAVAARFDGDPIVDQVNYGKEIADKIFSVTSQARNFLLVFIGLLGIVAILLISNTIRLSIFARKREVEIMKLVGATNWFIRWPFLIEGVFVGFVAVPLDAVPYVVVTLILLAVGVVIGAVGSGIGLRRFLKV